MRSNLFTEKINMELKSKIESLLFIAAKPLSVKQLAEIIRGEEREILAAGDALVEDYRISARGLQIIKDGNKFQSCYNRTIF